MKNKEKKRKIRETERKFDGLGKKEKVLVTVYVQGLIEGQEIEKKRQLERLDAYRLRLSREIRK